MEHTHNVGLNGAKLEAKPPASHFAIANGKDEPLFWDLPLTRVES